LTKDVSWAKQALESASLDPEESTYHQRIHHFLAEKEAINDRFVPWLIDRILFHTSHGKHVRLVVESGTSLKATLAALAPRLFEKQNQLQNVNSGQIEIVTNNFPGAEAYEAFASKHRTVDNITISERVPCHIVPGRALRDYAAVVGTEAKTYLETFRKTAPKECIFIGLIVGNWVSLEGGTTTQPVPLARGDGHKQVKEQVVEMCDELYLLSPLCKMFQGTCAEFNRDFFEQYEEERRAKGEYERVLIPAEKFVEGRVKVVTTSRNMTQSIVYAHSVNVRACLGILGPMPEDYAELVGKPIQQIPHLVYGHDRSSTKAFNVQLATELPHEHTWNPRFRERYFRILGTGVGMP